MTLPPVRVPHPHVVLDVEGRPLVEGTTVPVRRLFGWHRQGTTMETLLRRYPQLGPARIFDALAFAYDNLELMTADLLLERQAMLRNAADTLPLLNGQRQAAQDLLNRWAFMQHILDGLRVRTPPPKPLARVLATVGETSVAKAAKLLQQEVEAELLGLVIIAESA